MMRARVAVGIAGLFGTVLALLLVVSPESVSSLRPVELLVATLPVDRPRELLAGIGIVVGLAATVFFRADSDEERPPLVTTAPEVAEATDPIPGDRFDSLLAGGEDGREKIQETIRSTAIEALVQRTGVDRSTARNAVERGTWTDDPVAAAVLGTPPFPLRSRLRAWLDPQAERRRRVQRVVVAIEELQPDSGPSVSDAPGGEDRAA